jgi:hypothetical protein
MMMNDNEMMLDYLLGMGAMQPEMQDLRRRQAMVEQLGAYNAQQAQGANMMGGLFSLGSAAMGNPYGLFALGGGGGMKSVG